MKYNNGIDIEKLVDDYIENHKDELMREEFEAYCSSYFDRKELIDDINEFLDDDDKVPEDAIDEKLFEVWSKQCDIWEYYSYKDSRAWIAEKIQEELDEEFCVACNTFKRELKKIANKYDVELCHEESHMWNPGIIRSQYFYFEDEDGNFGPYDLIIRFGDNHDNGRNGCDFDLDFREISENLSKWLDDIEGNLTTLLHI